ncbi:MAG: glutathione S-transferase family protein [Pseudomonadales bacterium]
MKLYYSPGTSALAIHVVLAWSNIKYTLEKVVIGSEEYKKINPLGAVPALVDGDGPIMTQADSLLKYIANKQSDGKFAPQHDIQAEQQLDQWLAFIGSDLHPTYSRVFNQQRFTTAADEQSLAAVKAAAELRLDTLYQVLDQHLAQNTFITGEQKSIADPYAYVMTSWMKYTALRLNDYPNVERHFNELKQDKGVIQAESEQDIR